MVRRLFPVPLACSMSSLPLPASIRAQLQDHPSLTDDRFWILDGIIHDVDAMLSLNRRYVNEGSRTLFGTRYRRLHNRAATAGQWFEHVFGRPVTRGEQEVWNARAPTDASLTGFQAFELLQGFILPRTIGPLQLFPAPLRLAHLIPFLVEYMGYRLQFNPEAHRYLEGIGHGACRLSPDFARHRAHGEGAGIPARDWAVHMWVGCMHEVMRMQEHQWRPNTGRWTPVFTGRDRPASAPFPVPLMSIRPPGATQEDLWGMDGRGWYGIVPSGATEPEPERAPSSPATLARSSGDRE